MGEVKMLIIRIFRACAILQMLRIIGIHTNENLLILRRLEVDIVINWTRPCGHIELGIVAQVLFANVCVDCGYPKVLVVVFSADVPDSVIIFFETDLFLQLFGP